MFRLVASVMADSYSDQELTALLDNLIENCDAGNHSDSDSSVSTVYTNDLTDITNQFPAL